MAEVYEPHRRASGVVQDHPHAPERLRRRLQHPQARFRHVQPPTRENRQQPRQPRVAQHLEQRYQWIRDVLPPGQAAAADADQVHWMLEELRVSLFAQQLGTAHPVSEKRILQVVHAR